MTTEHDPIAIPAVERSAARPGRVDIARRGAGSLAAGMSSQLLTVVSSVISARMLGPTSRGELVALLLWPSLFAAAGGLNSLGEAIVYSVAQSPTQARRSLAGTILALTCVQAVVITAIAYALLPLLFGRYGPDVLTDLRVFLIWIPLSLLASNGLSIVVGQQQIGWFNLLRLVAPATTAVGLLILASANVHALRPVVLTYLVGAVAATIVTLAWVARAGLGRPASAGVVPMVKYAAKTHIGWFSGVANERGDQALISVMLTPYALGIYSAAVSIASPIVMVGNSVAPTVLATVSVAGDVSVRSRRLASFLKASGVASLLLTMAILLVCKPLIVTLFGKAFEPALTSCQILLFAAAILSVGRVSGAGLKSFNLPFVSSRAELAGFAVTLVLLLAFLPRYGIVGAAVASLIAYSVSLALMVVSFVRRGLERPSDLVVRGRDVIAWRYAISRLLSTPAQAGD